MYREGKVPDELINSSNCRKMHMRLRRFCEAKNQKVNCPNMVQQFEASNSDKLSLLRSWMKNMEDPAKVEMELKYEKEVENAQTGEEQLLTIEGMRKAGVSELLGCMYCQSHT